MNKKLKFLARVLLLAILAGNLVSLGMLSANSYEESVNIALNQSITATSNYVPPEGFFDVTFLVDGHWETYPNPDGGSKLGWNNDVTATFIDENDPCDITISLDSLYLVDKIVLKPMKWNKGESFPRGYELQVSEDSENWKTLVTETNVSAVASSDKEVKPIEYKIQPQNIKYFRLHITKNSKCIDNMKGSYISSIGEIELYGKDTQPVKEAKVNKYALAMNPGEQDKLEITTGKTIVTSGVTFKSSNKSVATVDADGTVHAVAPGKANITIHDGNTGKDYTVPVTIENFDVHDKFQIVAFIPYFYEKDINPTTFDNLKKGGITNVELNFALDTATITYENNLKAIQYCAERGLDITVSESSFNAGSWQNKTDEEILAFVRRYSHLPGVEAYYIVDEPQVATQFARPIALVKSIDPYAVTHMNFCGAYEGIVTPLQKLLEKDYNKSLDYIMYDAYVFRAPTCDETTLYSQLEYNRRIGQKLNVPTATYIQSMAWNGCNRPNADAVRYQVYASLAAGVKQISYFCWQTPRANQYETYGPAIIDIDGNPTDLFEPVSKINAAVQALGDTLMKLDTKTVYHTGSTFNGFNQLPAGYYITPVDWDQSLTFGYMTEKETGRNYTMLVNRDYNNSAEVKFTVSKDNKTLTRISPESGKPEKLTPDANGVYTLKLLAGEGALLETDADYKYELKQVTNFHFLEKAIEAAETVDLSVYREQGQSEFKNALAKAKEVFANKSAKQTEVDKALNNLRKAQLALKPLAAEGVNLALHAKVTASTSYEEGTYFSTAYITDGVYTDMSKNSHQGWSVDPYGGLDVDSPAWVTVDLGDTYKIKSFLLRPTIYNGGQMTPEDFEIRISNDNKEWKTIRKEAGLKLDSVTDLVYSFEGTEGRYVQIYITRHSDVKDAGTGGALSQIGEIEIYGSEINGEEQTVAEEITTAIDESTVEVTTSAETSSDEVSEETTAEITDSTTAEKAVDTTEAENGTTAEEQTQKVEKKGCKSTVLPLAMLLTLVCATVFCFCKSRKAKG